MRASVAQCVDSLDLQAKPFFGVVRTLRDAKPKCAVLENVAGLEFRYVHDDGEKVTCLEYILRTLRRECPEYLFCVIPPSLTCPTASGYKVRRPREYILVASKRYYRDYVDDVAFGSEAGRIFTTLVTSVAGTMSSASGPVLHSAGVPAPPRHPMAFCRCSFGKPCKEHPCPSQCKCRGDASRSRKCVWRQNHKKAWAKLPPAMQHYSYFEDLYATYGIDAEMSVSSPRERDLLNLRVAEHGGVSQCKDAVLDISQSYGWDQWRVDGCVPTLATGSAIYAIGAGTRLTPQVLFALMGFPATHQYQDFAPHKVATLLGNTMHVSIVGFAVATLLAMRSA